MIKYLLGALLISVPRAYSMNSTPAQQKPSSAAAFETLKDSLTRFATQSKKPATRSRTANEPASKDSLLPVLVEQETITSNKDTEEINDFAEKLRSLSQQTTSLWEKEAQLNKTDANAVRTFSEEMTRLVKAKKEIISRLSEEQVKAVLLQPIPQEERADMFFDICKFWRGTENATAQTLYAAVERANKDKQTKELQFGGLFHTNFTESKAIARIILNVAEGTELNDSRSFFQALSDKFFVKNKCGRFLKRLFFGTTHATFFRILGNAKTLEDILSIDRAFPKTVYLSENGKTEAQDYQGAWKKLKATKIMTLYTKALSSKDTVLLQQLKEGYDNGDLLLSSSQIQKVEDILTNLNGNSDFEKESNLEDDGMKLVTTKNDKTQQSSDTSTVNDTKDSKKNSVNDNTAADAALKARQAREAQEKAEEEAYEKELERREQEQRKLQEDKLKKQKALQESAKDLHAESAA